MKYQIEERENEISPLLGFWEIETDDILDDEQLESLKKNFKIFAKEHNEHEVQSYIFQKYGDMEKGWEKYLSEELMSFFEKPFRLSRIS